MALIKLYILLGMCSCGTAMDGFAPRYSPHLMQRVAERRGLSTEGCLISSAYYPLGTRLAVWGVNTKVLRWCTVVDVSHPLDVARHKRTKRIIELDAAMAPIICGNLGKPTDCGVIVFFIGGS
jgi:hypothetical protein